MGKRPLTDGELTTGTHHGGTALTNCECGAALRTNWGHVCECGHRLCGTLHCTRCMVKVAGKWYHKDCEWRPGAS